MLLTDCSIRWQGCAHDLPDHLGTTAPPTFPSACASSSSAPASPASAPPSSSTSTASATSSSSTRAQTVGGTWRDNTYPGAACDVPSQLYSFSFAPNPDWSRSFSPQPEIHAYLERTAREAGVLDRFRFGVTVEDAAWDEEEWAPSDFSRDRIDIAREKSSIKTPSVTSNSRRDGASPVSSKIEWTRLADRNCGTATARRYRDRERVRP